jgi:hypothetical protein
MPQTRNIFRQALATLARFTASGGRVIEVLSDPEGVNLNLQAKISYHLIQRNGRFIGTAIGLQCCSAQVSIFRVVHALLHQLPQMALCVLPVSMES